MARIPSRRIVGIVCVAGAIAGIIAILINTTRTGSGLNKSVSIPEPDTSTQTNRPNIIVIQPDDFPFFQEWGRPPANPEFTAMLGGRGAPGSMGADRGPLGEDARTEQREEYAVEFPNGYSMPYLEQLRTQGLHITQAYAASAACSPSRFSTITGRYPSRSGYSRNENMNFTDISSVRLLNTKLLDARGQANDCTEDNIAVLLKKHGYRTGIVGKWHLSLSLGGGPGGRRPGGRGPGGRRPGGRGPGGRGPGGRGGDGHGRGEGGRGEGGSGRGGGASGGGRGPPNGPGSFDRDPVEPYNVTQAQIKKCGFDFADGIYRDNLPRDEKENYSHNHEWVTSKAIEFITSDENANKPFFLYFNPTVPHPSGDVEDALVNFTCLQTPNGLLEEEPEIPKMTGTHGCKHYRDSIFQRAGTSKAPQDLGAIWIDDSVGALIQTLTDVSKLDNTIFLFQLDHGVDALQTHWENGIRVAQFVHYPNEFGTGGLKLSKPVSTVDVAPTLLDFVGIDKNKVYEMDGESWRNYPKTKQTDPGMDNGDDTRCLMSEYVEDRSLVCGRCHKLTYLLEGSTGSTANFGEEAGYASGNTWMYFNLCDENGDYVNYPNESKEITNVAWKHWDYFMAMQTVMECLLEKTSPNKPLDFSTSACSFQEALEKFRGQDGPPAQMPTPSPTVEPTVSFGPTKSSEPTALLGCRDDTSTWIAERGPYEGSEIDCTFVAGRKGGRACRGTNGQRCPVTCGLCDEERLSQTEQSNATD